MVETLSEMKEGAAKRKAGLLVVDYCQEPAWNFMRQECRTSVWLVGWNFIGQWLVVGEGLRFIVLHPASAYFR